MGKDPFNTVDTMIGVLIKNKYHSQKTASVMSFYSNISSLFDVARQEYQNSRVPDFTK
jgi:hypothetical protein